MQTSHHHPAPSAPAGEFNPARINGVAINDAPLLPEELRQRACTELLRQAAQKAGLLNDGDHASTDGIISEAATAAIEALLERDLDVPEPSDEACLRHYNAHRAEYATGERVKVRHILFAVTPGVDVTLLRKRAEAALLDVRCYEDQPAGEDASYPEDLFARTARELSNCLSGARGGELGWLESADCAPEFARELFGKPDVGVLPRLVHSRFGLHVVQVQAREPGQVRPFESVLAAVSLALKRQAYVTALRLYLRVLAGGAAIEGVDIEAAESPLVQ